jgi:hypothetical protein
MCNSLNADKHGVAQHCVPAVVYVAQDDWVVNGTYLSSHSSSIITPASY